MPPAASALTLSLFGLLLAQRIGELVLSARHVRASRAQCGAGSETFGGNPARERALYVVHALFFVLPVVEAAQRGWPAPLMPLWLGVALLVLAQAVRLWTMTALGAGWRIPAVAFKGDPIVTHGPYAYVRHPNHAAVLVEFLVAPLLAGAPLAWVLLNVVHTPFVLARVRREERALARIGPYAARLGTRPLFIPRLTGAHASERSAGRSIRRKERCN